MTQTDWANFSGEESYRRPPSIEADIIRMDGEKGTFKRVVKTGDKYIGTEFTKPEQPIEAVFLRVRRRLTDFSGGYTSTEHNTPRDTVILFGRGGERITGTAAELREKYQSLRTEQVIYILDSKHDLHKLIVKGASLGSKSKPKGSVPFYEYLKTFTGDDHVWQYKTQLTPVQETNQAGKTYYAISFSRGEKLTDQYVDSVVGPKMQELHGIFAAQESFYGAKAEKETEHVAVEDTQPESEEEVPVIDLDEPEGAGDVPF